MKLLNYTFAFLIACMLSVSVKAQDLYTVTSGELIFSWNTTTFNEAFQLQYPGASMEGSSMRFTLFFHIGEYLHYDFNNTVGLFTGLGIRNVGMITQEVLPQTVALSGQDVAYTNYNIVRRQYFLGLPLAFKIGDFGKNFYLFAGGEYELGFVYKQKYWSDTFNRDGDKTKYDDWFGSETPLFIPSVFAGMQFPGGVNVRFKYYLDDFLDNTYTKNANSQDGGDFNVGDLSRYSESQVFYVSACWQFINGEKKKKEDSANLY